MLWLIIRWVNIWLWWFRCCDISMKILSSQWLRTKWNGHWSDRSLSKDAWESTRFHHTPLCSQCLFSCGSRWSSSIDFQSDRTEKWSSDRDDGWLVLCWFEVRSMILAWWFRSIVSLVSFCSTKHKHWSMTMRSPIRRTSLCTVSERDLGMSWRCWMCLATMLSAARTCHDAVRSRKLYERMQSLFPDQKSKLISASILVSNTYLSVGDEQGAQDIRSDRNKRWGNKVRPGVSRTEVNGEVVVNQRSTSMQWFEDFPRNFMPTTDLILDPTRSTLKWIDWPRNWKNTAINSIPAGSPAHWKRTKHLNPFCVLTVRS